MNALIVILLVAVLAALVVLIAMARANRTPASVSLPPEETDRVAAAFSSGIAAQQAEALKTNSDHFLELAETRLKQETARGEEQLKSRQGEIDKGLKEVREEMTKMQQFVRQLDAERGKSIENLATVATESQRVTETLRTSTAKLNEALAGGQARGQWGERMAEDVLRVAGFVEGLQYRKQTQIESGTGRPDFTFLLPDDRVLHMDVKFPLAEYMRYLEGQNDSERDQATKAFLRDVKARIKEVTSRDYIDPANGTLDYTLVFIPNEQVYGFIHEKDSSILDYALQNKVVVCSPLTLFAVLAVIRQSADNFRLAGQTNSILQVLGGFNKEWSKFKEQMDRVGKQLDTARGSFDSLVSTRTNMLDKQVAKVEELRLDAGIEDDETAMLTEADVEPRVEAGLAALQEPQPEPDRAGLFDN